MSKKYKRKPWTVKLTEEAQKVVDAQPLHKKAKFVNKAIEEKYLFDKATENYKLSEK